MKQLLYLPLVFLFCINSTLFAQSPWTKKADMHTGRWELSTCVVEREDLCHRGCWACLSGVAYRGSIRPGYGHLDHEV